MGTVQDGMSEGRGHVGRLLGENPVIGIRPVIDAREGMSERERFSGESRPWGWHEAAAKLIRGQCPLQATGSRCGW